VQNYSLDELQNMINIISYKQQMTSMDYFN